MSSTTKAETGVDLDMLKNLPLAESDGIPLDSPWHRDCINLLIDSIKAHFHDRTDFYVGGDMFLYYSAEQAMNRDYRGPDFFFVNGVDRHRERRYWAVWLEDWRFPDVIIELLSPTTAKEDRTTKFTLYEQTFHTRNYFMYDPDTRTLEGFILRDGEYEALKPNDQGWLWSEELGLWLGRWKGEYLSTDATWLRFYDDKNQLVLTYGEQSKQQADIERQRANTERQRADEAEAELVRLRALLSQKGTTNGAG